MIWFFFILGLWYLTGVISFIYWWSKDCNSFNGLAEYLLACLAGIMGPVAWIVGFVLNRMNRM